MISRTILACTLFTFFAGPAFAERFILMTGVDSRLYPGADRFIFPVPGPGFPGTFNDGDRLAGTANRGPTVPFVGVGSPLYQPNQFGSLSFLFKRGSAPAGGSNVVPLMGIDFLGGPRLDLDGNLLNATRSLVPVIGQTPVELNDVASFIDLGIDVAAGAITIRKMDSTGNNEGGPFVTADIATVLVTTAGTGPEGQSEAPPNPGFDTRSGALTPFTGASGTLTGVYRISNLQCEFWYDSIDPNSSSADTLGTFQYFATLRGWLIRRDATTGAWPTLAGQGLGATIWPAVANASVGTVVNTAHGLAGGTAVITAGKASDNYAIAGNGGLPLTDFSGDLGAYFDNVVLPLASSNQYSVVYLESVGYGVNNSGDPVFTDTIGYDVVLIAAAEACLPCDLDCNGSINPFDIQPFVNLLSGAGTPCSPCAGDADGNGTVNPFDIQSFLDCLSQ